MGDILIEITLVTGAFIIIGLVFTHFYAGHKINGLLYAATGLTSSTIGYLISTLLPPENILIYFSNLFFVIGVTLFFISSLKLVNRKINYIEIAIVISLFAIAMAIFLFVFFIVMIRQLIVSLVVIYITSRQVYLLLRHHFADNDKYLYSYLILGIVIIALQFIRVILIGLGIINTVVPALNMTANILILIITAVVFDVLAMVLVLTTSLTTRNELLKERKLLEEWSTTDYLTRTPNRRKLYQQLEILINKDIPFAVVITDLDGFKQINDQYGHPVGDAVLMEYAKRIEETKKSNTFVARFGGDEFVYIFPYFVEKQTLIENIVTSLSLHNIVVDNKKYNFDIRSSAGVAIYPKDGKTISELLKKADHSLYMMKTTNRNHIGFYEDMNAD